MNVAGAVQTSGRVSSPEGDASIPAPHEGGESLLPIPHLDVLAAGDALSKLYLFETEDRQLGVDQGTRIISALQVERNHALQKEQAAIEREDAR